MTQPTTPDAVTLRGKTYPCYVTMGALRRFRRATGHAATTIDTDDPDESVTFMYCCVASACAAEGVEFDIDADLFADLLRPADIGTFYAAMTRADDETDEKKTTVPTSTH